VPADKSVPSVATDRVVAHSEYAIITDVVLQRTPRPPNAAAESRALHTLARLMTGEPQRLLDGLARTAVELCGASADTCTAGVSLLESLPDGGEQFRWVTVAGALARYVGGTAARNGSPCGTCLDQGKPMVFSRPDLHFDYLFVPGTPYAEELVVPFSAEEGQPPLGAIWVAAHPDGRGFDADDVRILTTLAAVTGAAFRLSQARDEAVSANWAKSDFLAAMSHELRTPLNAIAGYAELIELGVAGPVTPAQQEYLSRMRKSGQFLLALINDVLHFTRLDAGAIELSLGPVPVHVVLTAAKIMAEPQLHAKGIVYEMNVGDPGWHVRADEGKVDQILLNLLTNAIKFTERGGHITVTCTRQDNTIRIRIADTGHGIAPEHLHAVFEPFVQVSRTLTPSHQQGVGLGLSISRTLARRMHGDLIVESEPGVGSAFTLVLPADG
jgi:signal transduction histidine kinase